MRSELLEQGSRGHGADQLILTIYLGTGANSPCKKLINRGVQLQPKHHLRRRSPFAVCHFVFPDQPAHWKAEPSIADTARACLAPLLASGRPHGWRRDEQVTSIEQYFRKIIDSIFFRPVRLTSGSHSHRHGHGHGHGDIHSCTLLRPDLVNKKPTFVLRADQRPPPHYPLTPSPRRSPRSRLCSSPRRY